MRDFSELQRQLLERVAASEAPRSVLRAPELKELYAAIKDVPAEERANYGQSINELKQVIESAIAERENAETAK